MTADQYERIRDVVVHVLSLLTSAQYDMIEAESRGGRLTSGELQEAVEGIEIEMPPDEALHALDIVEVEARRGQFSVWVDLWTKGGRRSDLTLELTIVDDDYSVRFEIDNLHVL